MIKKISTSIIALTTVFLVGCQTSNAIKNAAADGMANMFTCEKIATAFDAYDQDKNSFPALEQITGMIGIDSSNLDSSKTASYFGNVKTGVNTALMLKGCSAI
ncbi:hypothetical protein CXF85_19595 [Colwellia sp. 75C3]|uniref:hypothetical protein n=1 Tax=Colwellia sp. 75C3 TaxID=888425 RepID=UPI000C33EEDC|nr:hypothetical protein [Colwellia sp. 75C3]PKG80972.1 hypothetical protein CXF85_19595 [Colwellia sp. 75C3]